MQTADQDRGPFKVQTIEYMYSLLGPAGEEYLSFHWTPESTVAGQQATPHLHIGRAWLSPKPPVFSTTLHKIHIPTRRLPIETVVRFLIEEIEVTPARADWLPVLAASERAFDQWKTR